MASQRDTVVPVTATYTVVAPWELRLWKPIMNRSIRPLNRTLRVVESLTILVSGQGLFGRVTPCTSALQGSDIFVFGGHFGGHRDPAYLASPQRTHVFRGNHPFKTRVTGRDPNTNNKNV